jgi:hypothetical protein
MTLSSENTPNKTFQENVMSGERPANERGYRPQRPRPTRGRETFGLVHISNSEWVSPSGYTIWRLDKPTRYTVWEPGPPQRCIGDDFEWWDQAMTCALRAETLLNVGITSQGAAK